MNVYIVVESNPDTGEIMDLDSAWTTYEAAFARSLTVEKESREPLSFPLNCDVYCLEVKDA